MAGQQTLSNRVATLETDMHSIRESQKAMTTAHKTMELTLGTISDGQTEIMELVKTAKSARAFARKTIWPIIASLATAGVFNPKVSAILTALFA